jgi:hypothetical protein
MSVMKNVMEGVMKTVANYQKCVFQGVVLTNLEKYVSSAFLVAQGRFASGE